VAFGTSDKFLDLKGTLGWLETKRTCMKAFTFKDKIGHFPQSDFPEKTCELLDRFIRGEELVDRSRTKRVGDSTGG